MTRSLNMHVVIPGSAGLTGEGAAAYFRLCWSLWTEQGSLPDEPSALARFAGVAAAAWVRVWDAIADRFEVCGGRVTHRAVSEAWAEESARRERADRASATAVAAKIAKRKAAQVEQRIVNGSEANAPTRIVNEPLMRVNEPSTDRSRNVPPAPPTCARLNQTPDPDLLPSEAGVLVLSSSALPMRSGSDAGVGARDRKAEAILAVFDHYRALHPRAFPKPRSSSREWAKIAARMDDGFTADDLCKAIDGYHVSRFHCGDNETQTKYQDLTLIVRDATHVNRGIEYASAPIEPMMTAKERRSVRAVRNIVERHGATPLIPKDSPWTTAIDSTSAWR